MSVLGLLEVPRVLVLCVMLGLLSHSVCGESSQSSEYLRVHICLYIYTNMHAFLRTRVHYKHTIHYALHSIYIPHILHITHYTLYKLHTTRYTLHATHYTLHAHYTLSTIQHTLFTTTTFYLFRIPQMHAYTKCV